MSVVSVVAVEELPEIESITLAGVTAEPRALESAAAIAEADAGNTRCMNRDWVTGAPPEPTTGVAPPPPTALGTMGSAQALPGAEKSNPGAATGFGAELGRSPGRPRLAPAPAPAAPVAPAPAAPAAVEPPVA